MTDDVDTDETEHRSDRVSSSRRQFLGATLIVPAFLGLPVGADGVSNRDSERGSMTIGAADDETVMSWIGHITDDQASLANDSTALSADPRHIRSLEVATGQQLRVQRSEDEYAVYTLVEQRPEVSQNLVRMSASARCRLDLGSRSLDGLNQQTCQTPLTDCSIGDEEFAATLSATVPHPSLSVEEARERDEFVEALDDRGSSIAMLAPHGGEIEPKTDEQAVHAGELVDATTWRAMGWRSDGGASHRWRIPSDEIHPASFPALEKIADREFDVAISFDGGCEDGIRVGGSADESLKRRVVDSINEALPASATTAELSEDDTTEQNGRFLVDRLAEHGITVTQGWAERHTYPSEIAEGVADAVSDVDLERPGDC